MQINNNNCGSRTKIRISNDKEIGERRRRQTRGIEMTMVEEDTKIENMMKIDLTYEALTRRLANEATAILEM